MVLLHAGVGDRRLWDDQLEAFAERFRVVRYDTRGFGEAPLPGGPFSYVDDLRALLDHLAIEQAALVGNSFGGRIAIDFALLHPARVTALVLVGSALSGHEHSGLETFDEQEDALLEEGRIDEAVELNLRTWLGPDVDAAARARVGEMQRQAFETMLPAYEREPQPGPVAWSEPPAAVRLEEIAVPTLVLDGADDVAGVRATSERLAAEIPGARREVLAGAAHLPGFEQPEAFNRVVLDFLAGVFGPASPGNQ